MGFNEARRSLSYIIDRLLDGYTSPRLNSGNIVWYIRNLSFMSPNAIPMHPSMPTNSLEKCYSAVATVP
jgi:hypothetical protein